MIRWLRRAKDEHHEEHCSKPRNPDLAVLVNQLTCQNNVLRGDNSDLIDMNNELCTVVEELLKALESRERCHGRDHSSLNLEVIVNHLIGRNNNLISQNNDLRSLITKTHRNEYLRQMIAMFTAALGLMFWNAVTWSPCR
eukprot:scaffold45430_cov76-Cyclotella_meneghiniana.AAC.6